MSPPEHFDFSCQNDASTFELSAHPETWAQERECFSDLFLYSKPAKM